MSVGSAWIEYKWSPHYERSLQFHIQSKHEGVSYGCQKCDYKAKHERLQCETDKLDVSPKYRMSKYDGITFDCNYCKYKATTKGNLIRHKQSKHEGVKYECDQCFYRTSW